VVEKLKETSQGPYRTLFLVPGIPGLRRAQAAYYERRFGVKLNPDNPRSALPRLQEGAFATWPRPSTAPATWWLVPNQLSDPASPPEARAGDSSFPSDATPAFCEIAVARHHPFDPKPIAVVVCYPSHSYRLRGRSSTSTRICPVRRSGTHLLLVHLAYAEGLLHDRRRPSILAGADAGAPWCGRSSSPRWPDLFMPGWRNRLCGSATSAIIGALAR